MQDSFSFVNLFDGLQSALGTNPVSLAAPAKDGDSFVLDMATTAVAVGKVNLLFYIIYVLLIRIAH